MRRNFKKMKIWEKAMNLCDATFQITVNFPKFEIYSLTSQINRSAISVPSNIAEGSSRSSNKVFSRFLEISFGSLYELQTQIILVKYKNYITENQLS